MAWNPAGTEAVEFFPAEACFWLGSNLMFAPGQKHRGSTCLPPSSGLDALIQFVIPKYRPVQSGLRLLGAHPMPDLAQRLHVTSVMNLRHEGVMARVEHTSPHGQIEEEFYAIGVYHPQQGPQLNWGLVSIFSLRAAKGKYDAAHPLLWQIAASLRPNPHFEKLYVQITHQLNGQTMAGQASVRQMQADEAEQGRKQAEFLSWQADMGQQRFNERWAADQRRNDQIGDNLSGQQRWEDPSNVVGNPHVHQGHEQYAWTNGQGEWIHVDDPSYNPNHDPNNAHRGSWQLVQRM